MAAKKSIAIHIQKKVYLLQQLKGMQNFKLGMWKGYHLSMKGTQMGYLSCQKWFIKG